VNIKEYISSGIVESYVLGLADETERAEFEQVCASNEEVRAARESFELSLEREAMAGTAIPPASIKQKLFTTLQINEPGESSQVKSLLPDQRIFKQTNKWVPYLAAASVVLLIASTILNFYLFSEYKEYSERYSSLLASQTELANNNKALQTNLDNYRNSFERLKDPDMSIIKMAGTKVPGKGSPNPASVATIYWHQNTNEVFLLVNNLPQPASDKQYQLWAIVDGKPVSAGVFDSKQGDAMIKMNNISKAQAFAITLEKTGGSPSPEGAMYVLGTI
jgi:anti-sigma-K factor RskA